MRATFFLVAICVVAVVGNDLCCPPKSMSYSYDQMSYSNATFSMPDNVTYVEVSYEAEEGGDYRLASTTFTDSTRKSVWSRVVTVVQDGVVYVYTVFASQGADDCWDCSTQNATGTAKEALCYDLTNGREVKVVGQPAVIVHDATFMPLVDGFYSAQTSATYARHDDHCFVVSLSSQTAIKLPNFDASYSSYSVQYYNSRPLDSSSLLDIPPACLKDPRCSVPN
jgi:hypothetical protein